MLGPWCAGGDRGQSWQCLLGTKRLMSYFTPTPSILLPQIPEWPFSLPEQRKGLSPARDGDMHDKVLGVGPLPCTWAHFSPEWGRSAPCLHTFVHTCPLARAFSAPFLPFSQCPCLGTHHAGPQAFTQQLPGAQGAVIAVGRNRCPCVLLRGL